jgi:hypothetical protein
MATRSLKGTGPMPRIPDVIGPGNDRQSLPHYFQDMDIDSEENTKKNSNAGVIKARHLTIKGHGVNSDQRALMETIITTARECKNSNDRSVLAIICAAIQESNVENLKKGSTPGSTAAGVFQLLESTALAFRLDPADTEACAEHFMLHGFTGAGGAIAIARKNPNMRPGDIAWKVEGSSAAENKYAQWEDEAKKWLEAVKGGRVEGGEKQYRKQFQFQRRKDENSWDCMQRLANDVKWRCFPVGRVLYYMSETDLFARRVAYHLTPDDPALIEFTYDIDWRAKVPVNEGVITINLARFGAPPGYPIELDGFGPPDGRWLIISVRRDWFSPIAEVTIRQPIAPAKEPEPETGNRNTGGAETDGAGMKLYKACRHISNAGGPYVYGGGHGPPLSSLSGGQGLDCSSSTSLALYRADLWDHQATARVSGDFNTWGKPGRGNIFTVCYSGSHVYIRFEDALSVDAERFDTSPWGDTHGSGPRLRTTHGRPNDEGMALRHWPEM